MLFFFEGVEVANHHDCLLEDAAAKLSCHQAVHFFIQLMIIVVLLFPEKLKPEVSRLQKIAQTHSVQEVGLDLLQHFIDGDIRFLTEYFRQYSYHARSIKRMFKRCGWLSGLRQYGLMRKWPLVPNMPKVARFYRNLQQLPEGTLGHLFWQRLAKSKLPCPGEKGAFIEDIVWHDLLHVVTGYPTTWHGEVEIAAFQAGMIKEGFYVIVFLFLQFHFGIRIAKVAVAAKDKLFDAKLLRQFLAAWKRGCQTPFDFSDNWQFKADMSLTVEQIKRKYQMPDMDIYDA